MKIQSEKGFVMSSLVKIILIGILIVAIPVSVKLVQEQQILKSRADDSSDCIYDNNGPYPAAEGTPCGDGKVCNGQGECIPVSSDVQKPCTDGSGTEVCSGTLYYDSRGNKCYNGTGACGDSGGQKPPTGGTSTQPSSDEAPSQPESNYCEAAGYHKCGTVGANLGSCTQDGKSCTKYETYQCNFEGTNYCGDSAEQPECRDCQLSNVGVGTLDAPSAPAGGGTPAGIGSMNSKCDDGTVCKVSQNTTPPACCAPVPNSTYKWTLIQPGTGGAPGIDVARFGANNACGGSTNITAHDVCPKNTTDPLNVRASTSNWCYEFTEGNRCIQLRHEGTSGGAGGGGGSPGIDTGTCNIDGQSPDLGPTCAACLDSKVPGVVTNIKNMNPTDFNGC
ncbi:MAG: hypothetical protein NUV73_04220, partial [Candidatus Daviesbacteria bacterium]|nr:hypothetical protein [Candidatus Daviesbacteria bacterium]